MVKQRKDHAVCHVTIFSLWHLQLKNEIAIRLMAKMIQTVGLGEGDFRIILQTHVSQITLELNTFLYENNISPSRSVCVLSYWYNTIRYTLYIRTNT